jgi:hypothetical protein
LSPGQVFSLSAKLKRSLTTAGWKKANDSYFARLELVDYDSLLLHTDPLIQDISADSGNADVSGSISWRDIKVKDMKEKKSFNMAVRVVIPPLDRNSGFNALYANSPEELLFGNVYSFKVLIQRKTVIIEPVDMDRQSFANSQDSIPLVKFSVLNEAGNGQQDSVLFDFMRVKILDRDNNTISNPSSLLRRLWIAQSAPEEVTGKRQSSPYEFVADVIVPDNDSLITIQQTQEPPVTVPPSNKKYIYTLFGDLNPEAKSAVFRVVMNELNFKQENGRLDILLTDTRGDTLSVGDDFEDFTSERHSVVDVGTATAFANYPNPFHRRDVEQKGGTVFSVYLEKEKSASSVEIKIYNLLGELVRTLRSDNITTPGGSLYQRLVWDGRNGAGAEVINGVYPARITVNYSDGSTKTEITKVVYIK